MNQSAATTMTAIIAALTTVAPILTGRAALDIPPGQARPFITLQPAKDDPKDGVPVQRFRQEWTRTLFIEVFYDAGNAWDSTADTLLNAIRAALVSIKGTPVFIEAIGFTPPNEASGLATLQLRAAFHYTLQFTE
ncbi:MAG: hypothetical protein ACOYMW_15615 [Candidatus Competibacteraceae bacterium]